MKAFLVRGRFRMTRDWTQFSKEVAAEDERDAVERVTSDLGSKHRVKRNDVRVEKVSSVPPEQVEDSVVRFKLGEKR